jgi:hypothetical protein
MGTVATCILATSQDRELLCKLYSRKLKFFVELYEVVDHCSSKKLKGSVPDIKAQFAHPQEHLVE